MVKYVRGIWVEERQGDLGMTKQLYKMFPVGQTCYTNIERRRDKTVCFQEFPVKTHIQAWLYTHPHEKNQQTKIAISPVAKFCPPFCEDLESARSTTRIEME